MNVPRFSRSPVDTSVYYQMLRPVNPYIDVIKTLRKIITNVTGMDPYNEQRYRGRKWVQSRQLFLYFVRRCTNLTQTAAGQMVHKDHATVVHAEKCVENFISIENSYKNTFDEIIKELERHKIKPLL